MSWMSKYKIPPLANITISAVIYGWNVKKLYPQKTAITHIKLNTKNSIRVLVEENPLWTKSLYELKDSGKFCNAINIAKRIAISGFALKTAHNIIASGIKSIIIAKSVAVFHQLLESILSIYINTNDHNKKLITTDTMLSSDIPYGTNTKLTAARMIHAQNDIRVWIISYLIGVSFIWWLK